MKVLSTKILSNEQKKLFQNTNIGLVEYNAISIQFLEFEALDFIKNAIFSSQNAVQSIVEKKIKIENVFCVGEKTKQFLIKNGQNIVKMSKNASELGDFIKKNYQNEDFYFFSGNLRMEAIPDSIRASKNTIFELKTYKTELNSMKFYQKWDGILFFSPSAVKSFTTHNSLTNTPIFCIGNTTAKEAKKHTELIYIADNQSIEGVIEKAIKTLQND